MPEKAPTIDRAGGLWPAVRRRVKRLFIAGPGRDRWQNPERVVAALGLRPGQRVADVGSGSGYFTLRLARAAAPDGRVYAVDTDRDMLWLVQQQARAEDLDVWPLLAGDERLDLPEKVDLFFTSHTYHHLPNVVGYMRAAANLLAPGGRVAIVEGRPKGILTRLFGHVTEPGRLRVEMVQAGYRLVVEHDFLERDSFMIFEPS